MVQFSQNIAQYMLPGAERYPLMTLERTLSIVSFLLGSFLGAKGGARWGDRKRGWQATSAVIQSIFLFGASAILWTRPEFEPPNFRYWPGVIIMTAFSMGMQSIAAQKLVSPAFATVSACVELPQSQQTYSSYLPPSLALASSRPLHSRQRCHKSPLIPICLPLQFHP